MLSVLLQTKRAVHYASALLSCTFILIICLFYLSNKPPPFLILIALLLAPVLFSLLFFLKPCFELDCFFSSISFFIRSIELLSIILTPFLHIVLSLLSFLGFINKQYYALQIWYRIAFIHFITTFFLFAISIQYVLRVFFQHYEKTIILTLVSLLHKQQKIFNVTLFSFIRLYSRVQKN